MDSVNETPERNGTEQEPKQERKPRKTATSYLSLLKRLNLLPR